MTKIHKNLYFIFILIILESTLGKHLNINLKQLIEELHIKNKLQFPENTGLNSEISKQELQ
jgi:hypothetical protein